MSISVIEDVVKQILIKSWNKQMLQVVTWSTFQFYRRFLHMNCFKFQSWLRIDNRSCYFLQSPFLNEICQQNMSILEQFDNSVAIVNFQNELIMEPIISLFSKHLWDMHSHYARNAEKTSWHPDLPGTWVHKKCINMHQLTCAKLQIWQKSKVSRLRNSPSTVHSWIARWVTPGKWTIFHLTMAMSNKMNRPSALNSTFTIYTRCATWWVDNWHC